MKASTAAGRLLERARSTPLRLARSRWHWQRVGRARRAIAAPAGGICSRPVRSSGSGNPQYLSSVGLVHRQAGSPPVRTVITQLCNPSGFPRTTGLRSELTRATSDPQAVEAALDGIRFVHMARGNGDTWTSILSLTSSPRWAGRTVPQTRIRRLFYVFYYAILPVPRTRGPSRETKPQQRHALRPSCTPQKVERRRLLP